MRSEAQSVDAYLAELPADRREEVALMRQLVLDNLPPGYEEAMGFGMISYEIPLATYPETYNRKPLMYAALASQKRHISIYLMSIYAQPDAADTFEQAYRATGKRYDAGKACVRFRTLDDVPLNLIAEAIASTSVEQYIALTEAARSSTAR
ncbi:MAG TPA: DUF1801 domain-containing protein [Dehalococcoidia bacterium]|nr:DUF1801 domain-containing protein [Dehalococcoidia bacterium]